MNKETVQATFSQIRKLKEFLQLDIQTANTAEDLLMQIKDQPFNNPQALAKVLVWIASKQQTVTALDGSIIQGSGVSINSILKDNLNEVLQIGAQLNSDLNNLKIAVDMLTSLMKKMENVLSNFNYKDNNVVITNIAWLLFVILRKSIIKPNDMVESICLLISVMHLVITQTIDKSIVSKGFENLKVLSETNHDQFTKDTLQALLFQFKIKDYELFSKIHSQSQIKFGDLIRTGIIKVQKKNNNTITAFNASIANSNYRKLDLHYHTLIVDEFDETLLLPSKISTLTPKKFTPAQINLLARKQEVPRMAPQPNKTYQRLLNYETEQYMAMKTNIKEIKLPAKSISSPYAQQTVIATPMTAAMEMYNWLLDKQNQFKKFLKKNQPSLKLLQQQEQVQMDKDSDLIDQVFEELFLKLGESTKKSLYWSLFVKMLENMNSKDCYLARLRSLMGVCIDCVHYIISKSSTLIEQIVPDQQLSNYEVWVCLDYFLNNVKCPFQLKEYLLDLETKFISYYIWSSDSQSALLSFVNNFGCQQQSDFQRVFKRALHYCAYQIQCVGQSLVHDLEPVWSTVKYVLSDRTRILIKHSLDQIVLAALYAILKVTGHATKFQQLINVFEQQNQHYSKQFIKKIVCNVHLTEESMGSIVEFYNQIFIPNTKQFLATLGQNSVVTAAPKNPALNGQILSSPLNKILPQTPQQYYTKSMMTPATKLLYAYTESPFMKENLQLNNQSNNIMKKMDVYQEDTADFIQKKCKYRMQMKQPHQSQQENFQKLLNFE